MVLRRDGFGGTRYYPENSEIHILCTYMETGHRYIIIHYLDLPFSYRQLNRDGLLFLEEHIYTCLLPELDRIDEGFYDDMSMAEEIVRMMK
ncbi:hypothetical protein QRD89_11430 [Halobacillus sp. ACCC02827]|uniref:hypothetical protein n=1 Tax=Bacillaceae TaxID=186817 RepID=UPI0002A4F314|nr:MULTISPECIES: hypothetical protein [Bacillaceae]ELK44953.1 hypothetical protein D479_16929 [Halobacillus sp. BAB-2008]QHT47109.1 hypothetical protein M662_11600 [Bacillus sp. SB49]WJE14336.1 hypothetical protein QRD89_11430 [Halobacillus sp. ACCC02827]